MVTVGSDTEMVECAGTMYGAAEATGTSPIVPVTFT